MGSAAVDRSNGKCLALLAACVGLFALSAVAGQPVGWLGDGSGVYADQNPPTSWDANTGTNILWKTRLPNWSNNSPFAINDRLYVRSFDYLWCIGRKGK